LEHRLGQNGAARVRFTCLLNESFGSLWSFSGCIQGDSKEPKGSLERLG
jgi:hypothetical protein